VKAALGHGDVTVLVDDLVEKLDFAGLAVARARGERAAAHMQPVARPHWPLPADFFDVGLVNDRRA
jgi:hypothetical protein